MRLCNRFDSRASNWCRDEPPPPIGLGFLLPFATSGGFFIRRSLSKTQQKAMLPPVSVLMKQTLNGCTILYLAPSPSGTPLYRLHLLGACQNAPKQNPHNDGKEAY